MPNIIAQDESFRTPDALFQVLAGFAHRCTGKLTIMAGHYMLVYRSKSNRLVPLMAALANAREASHIEREKAKSVGRFPEESFELGLRLLSAHPTQERKIALLVNDHQCQVFQADLPGGEGLARLKAEYYRAPTALPAPLRKLLDRHGLGEEVFERNDARRTGGTLPSKTFFFSENALRNNFAKRRKPWILTKPGFRRQGGTFAPEQLVYQSLGDASTVCLVDEHAGCGCNGAMTEFLLVLAEKGANSLIVFIPDECRVPVDQSIRATMEGLVHFDALMAVWGCDPFNGSPAEFREATVYRPAV